ncbi:MAG: lactate utilization protein, partial [Eubacteriales bacterium]|nr:lactate utilization protein [Eubacteriales bacterium]
MDLHAAAEKLRHNGFDCRCFATADDAKQAALAHITPGASVGIGGSMTVKQMDLHTALADRGCAIHWHWLAPPEQRAGVYEAARDADYYISSSNAITAAGELVNIDGTGNRVAAQFYGPKNVLILCGRNKLCGTLADALARIKREACPPNARRLGLKTPCALTGRCTDCASPSRICNVTTILSRPPRGRTITVYL